MKNLVTFIELIKLLGPVLQEAWPHIRALMELWRKVPKPEPTPTPAFMVGEAGAPVQSAASLACALRQAGADDDMIIDAVDIETALTETFAQ